MDRWRTSVDTAGGDNHRLIEPLGHGDGERILEESTGPLASPHKS
jgi:hypothetical protein